MTYSQKVKCSRQCSTLILVHEVLSEVILYYWMKLSLHIGSVVASQISSSKFSPIVSTAFIIEIKTTISSPLQHYNNNKNGLLKDC